MARTIPCPICRRPVPTDDPEMPFCSERCRLLDLANWADEKYRAPAGKRSELDELADEGAED